MSCLFLWGSVIGKKAVSFFLALSLFQSFNIATLYFLPCPLESNQFALFCDLYCSAGARGSTQESQGSCSHLGLLQHRVNLSLTS